VLSPKSTDLVRLDGCLEDIRKIDLRIEKLDGVIRGG
jgi:hypothetical protein